MVAMEGNWLLISGKSSLHRFGQSSSRALCIAAHGEQLPAFTAKAHPRTVTIPGAGDVA